MSLMEFTHSLGIAEESVNLKININRNILNRKTKRKKHGGGDRIDNPKTVEQTRDVTCT